MQPSQKPRPLGKRVPSSDNPTLGRQIPTEPSTDEPLGDQPAQSPSIDSSQSKEPAAQSLTADHPADRDAEDAAREIERINQAISGYQVYEEISRGGQGIVYRALQIATGRIVALKVLHPGREVTSRHVGRFTREIALVARLRHNHVAAVYDSGEVLGRPFFAMEFVDGLPIDDYVLLNRPSVDECVEMFVRVCRAVAAVHQCGVIHRDLKPSNILVDLDSQPHLLDFGFAKSFIDEDMELSLSVAGQVLGTLPYLCPDQVKNKSAIADTRSDVYALGVILHQLLTGKMPYPVDGSPREVCRNIAEVMPRSLERKRAADSESCAVGPISADLSVIVLKALAKEREHRYQSADALADDLSRYLAGDVVEARSGHRWYLLRKTLRHYRWHVGITAAFTLLLVGSLIGMTLLWRHADRAARTAQASLQLGALSRLASVERDEGRLEQAEALCFQAIALAEQTPVLDVAGYRSLYTSHHVLAQVYLYNANSLDASRKHAAKAAELAQRLVREAPEEPEFKRLLAYSQRIEGRIALNAKEWDRATSLFTTSIDGFRSLLQYAEPGKEAPLEFEVASSLQFLGITRCRAGDSASGMEILRSALQLFERAHHAYPHSMEYLLERTRTESFLATWLLRLKKAEANQRADLVLVPAIDRLERAINAGMAGHRTREADKLLQDLRTNKALTDKRLGRVPATN